MNTDGHNIICAPVVLIVRDDLETHLSQTKVPHIPASELGQLTGYKSFAQVYLKVILETCACDLGQV